MRSDLEEEQVQGFCIFLKSVFHSRRASISTIPSDWGPLRRRFLSTDVVDDTTPGRLCFASPNQSWKSA